MARNGEDYLTPSEVGGTVQFANSGLLFELLTNGFETFHNKLGQSGEKKDLQARLKVEFQTIGTIAALLKGITMNFCAKLHVYENFFNDPLLGEGHLSWWYYIYAGLNVLASFCMLMAILMSLINMIGVCLVTREQVPHYARKASFAIKLPFLALTYGVVVWHIALNLLMFFMIDFWFGIYFFVSCSFAIWVVFDQWGKVIAAVDRAWGGKSASPSNNVLNFGGYASTLNLANVSKDETQALLTTARSDNEQPIEDEQHGEGDENENHRRDDKRQRSCNTCFAPRNNCSFRFMSSSES